MKGSGIGAQKVASLDRTLGSGKGHSCPVVGNELVGEKFDSHASPFSAGTRLGNRVRSSAGKLEGVISRQP